MVWNQPSDNGQDRDPWGSNNTGKDKRKKPQGKPASSLFPTLQKELNRLLKTGKSGRRLRKPVKPLNIKSLLIPIAVVLVGGWVGSGLYTLPEGQVAVVTRFGKVESQVNSAGLNWYPKFIDQIYLVNIEQSRQMNYSDMLLTSDANLVQFTVNVDYKVTNAKDYLFNVAQPEGTLQTLLESAASTLIAQSSMQSLLTESKTTLDSALQRDLTRDLAPYNLGITLDSINITALQEPSELDNVATSLKSAKQDALKIVAQSQQAANQTLAQAQLQAQKIVADANLYQEKSEQNTQAEITKLSQLLPEYKAEPNLVKEKLYFDTMQRVLSKTNKVLFDGNSKNLLVLPTDELTNMVNQTSKQGASHSVISTATTTANSTTTANNVTTSQSAQSTSTVNRVGANNESSIFAQRAKNVRRLSNGAKGE